MSRLKSTAGSSPHASDAESIIEQVRKRENTKLRISAALIKEGCGFFQNTEPGHVSQ
jgi:hypothetical protein